MPATSARPIVMTTIAMGAGMLPVAFSLTGGDSSFRQPMAIVVIGGVITSTILSLLVIPVIFTFVDDLLPALRRLLPGTGPRRETTDRRAQALGTRGDDAFEPSLQGRGVADPTPAEARASRIVTLGRRFDGRR